MFLRQSPSNVPLLVAHDDGTQADDLGNNPLAKTATHYAWNNIAEIEELEPHRLTAGTNPLHPASQYLLMTAMTL
jgi:hypothetical protein